jgi:tetratricopeptide (TPR) repeat protein
MSAGWLAMACLFLLSVLPSELAQASARPSPIHPSRLGADLVRESEYAALSRASGRVQAGAYLEALPLLAETVEKNPTNILALFHLGGVYLELARQSPSADGRTVLLTQARQTFERVVDLNSDFTPPYFKLGKIALMQNDIEGAKRYYRQGLAVEPRNATLMFNLARVCDQNGERTVAIGYYRETLALDANFTFAYNNLALLYEEEHRYGEAEKAYKAALKHNAKYNLARLNLGNLYAVTGRYEAARRAFAEAQAQEPANTWVYYYEGNLHMRLSEYEQAATAYRRSIELDSGNATAYYLLAVSLSRLNRMDEALQASLHYMRLEPEGRYAQEMKSLILAMKLSQSGLFQFTPANLSAPAAKP